MSAGTRWGSDFDPDELARLETRMWKAYYRRQPARLFGTAGPGHPRAGSRVVAARARGEPAADPRRGRLRPRDRRLRALRTRHRARPTGCSVSRSTSTPRRSLVTSSAGGSSGARSASPRVRPPATRSPTCTPRSTTSRASGSRRRGGCAGWPPRSATAVRPTTRTARPAPGTAYWPEVARLLRESYRSLSTSLAAKDVELPAPPRVEQTV